MKKNVASLAVILLMLGAMPAIARAQDDPPQGSPNQPVKLQPGVARVSLIHGDVSSQRGDNGDWVAVTLNTPVVEGDRVATGQKSHAELQLDWADILRMSDSATARVANLNRTNIQVQVGQGLVTYTVLQGSEANSQIDTPNASIRPDGPGVYRILVNSDAETQVIVRQGSAAVSTPQGSTRVDKGEMITVVGTDNPEYQTASAPRKDDWDSWNDDRNRRISSAESWRKTNHYYTGSEDLDAYGRWSQVPDYGPVWIPAVGPGWAPYRDGRWVYEPYYGWTWVSYEPWGWAPYHYGRWFVYGANWVWWPGPVVAYPAYYPVWAPAYVSFFGFGGGGWGVSVGFGFGGYGRYGWLPCGPGDWYRPWYGRWGNRVNVVNVTNIHNTTIVNNYNNGFAPLAGHRRSRFSNLDEAFHNDRVRSGISSMPGHEFGRGAVSPHQERISESSFRQAGLVNGRMPVTPSRESFSPSGRAADPSAFRHAPPSTQRFFSGSATRPMTNPQATRSFANANGAGVQGQSPAEPNRNLRPFGRPSAQASSQTVPRAPSPTVNANRANSPAATQPSRPGWRTFTPPASAGANRSAQGSDANRQATPNNPDRGTFTPPSRPSSPAPFQGTAPRMPAGAQPENRGSWQHFTPPPRQSQPQESNRGFAQPGPAPQREFRPPAQAPHGNVPNSSTNSRPPLDMRQPIVRPRGGSYGSGAPQGSNSQPRGGYTAPRGGSSAPQGGGNRGGGGGRSGGGNSQGGGSGGGRQR